MYSVNLFNLKLPQYLCSLLGAGSSVANWRSGLNANTFLLAISYMTGIYWPFLQHLKRGTKNHVCFGELSYMRTLCDVYHKALYVISFQLWT